MTGKVRRAGRHAQAAIPLRTLMPAPSRRARVTASRGAECGLWARLRISSYCVQWSSRFHISPFAQRGDVR